MKKILLLFLFTLTGLNYIMAQQPKVEKSEAFDEPGLGWNKVLQMKNGKTLFLHFTKKDGIEVNVFGQDRKVASSNTITSDLWDPRKMKATSILGLYEINNEAVLFMAQADGRVPTLYRLRFDGNTGALNKEEEIGALPKIKLFSLFAEENNIYVEKDPESDCYAVIYFNGYAQDKDERIRVVHYDGNHKMINTAFYESPDENYKYLKFIGAVVDGSKRVFICSYGAASLRGKDARVYISRLKVGDSVFENKNLEFTEDFKETKSVMAYNHNTNTIRLLTMSFAKGKLSFFGNAALGMYLSFLSYIDPETLTLKKVVPLAGQKIDEYVHKTLNTKHDYHGLPQEMIINKDNSTTILSEEITQEVYVDQNGNVTKALSYLGAIGVNELNEDGTEKTGYAILKTQVAGGLFDPLYISSRSKGRWTFNNLAADYNSYLSYDYIGTEKNRYIIFNDDPKNFDKDEDEKRRRAVVNVNKLNTILYALNGPTINKSYLFGDPESKDQSNSCHIEASDFQKSTNTYATIMIERDGRDRQAKMVWLKFE